MLSPLHSMHLIRILPLHPGFLHVPLTAVTAG